MINEIEIGPKSLREYKFKHSLTLLIRYVIVAKILKLYLITFFTV